MMIEIIDISDICKSTIPFKNIFGIFCVQVNFIRISYNKWCSRNFLRGKTDQNWIALKSTLLKNSQMYFNRQLVDNYETKETT